LQLIGIRQVIDSPTGTAIVLQTGDVPVQIIAAAGEPVPGQRRRAVGYGVGLVTLTTMAKHTEYVFNIT
jgi:hypothetical protein